MKKILYIGIVFLAIIFVGCGSKDVKTEEGGTFVYYLNTDGNKIEPVQYEIKSKKLDKRIKELWNKFSSQPKEGKQTAFPKGVLLVKYKVDGNQITFYFDESYHQMSETREVLARAALVRTMLQLEEIDFISFFVEDTPLRDAKNNYVGVMTRDTFVENVGQQINSIGEQTCTLYLATEDGKNLKAVERTFHSLANVSNEKTVIDQLMEHDAEAGCQPTIPEGTNLISASTVDGVCFVVFDEGFLKQNYSIKEDVIIYSIVDSLCELPSVSKVQLSVKGKTGVIYRDDFSLDELYERNLDLLVTE